MLQLSIQSLPCQGLGYERFQKKREREKIFNYKSGRGYLRQVVAYKRFQIQ